MSDEQMAIEDLQSEDRLRLLRFVCSFAWSDLEIAEDEKTFIRDLVKKLKMDEDERDTVEGWIASPPDPDSVDPTEIPAEHRQIFLNTVLKLVMADGKVEPHEMDSFTLFEQLLR